MGGKNEKETGGMIGRGGGEGGGGRNSKERNEKDSVSVSGENQDSS